MRVTLNVDALQPQLSGIGRYTWELCKGLPKRQDICSVHFCRGGVLIDEPARLLSDPHYRPRQRRQLRWMYRWQASRVLRSSVVHGPNYFLPTDAEGGVITVHDLSVFRYPETHPPERVKSFEQLFASSLARADHVITDTETVRREIMESFSIDAGAVTAVPLGVGPEFRPMQGEEIAGRLAAWNIAPDQYALSVAAFEPRKKISELIHAWGLLPNTLRQSCPLVLAGGSGWRNSDLHEQMVGAAAEGWLKHLGFVDEAALPALYAGARLFIYPSIYEGFGLPPVEAMASGAPVIVANRSCLPEVCGDAARFIDPDDPDGFTSAIEACLCDEQSRSEMIRRGLVRARQFTWDRCVADTVAVYRGESV